MGFRLGYFMHQHVVSLLSGINKLGIVDVLNNSETKNVLVQKTLSSLHFKTFLSIIQCVKKTSQ